MRAFLKYWRREVGCVSLVMSVVAGSLSWFHQLREPFRESDQILSLIRSLESRHPADATPGKWKCAVGWTCTLHANSLDAYQADVTSIRQFREELATKLEGPVSMETIDWIWNSYAGLCPGGANYQRYRPVMIDEIANTP